MLEHGHHSAKSNPLRQVITRNTQLLGDSGKSQTMVACSNYNHPQNVIHFVCTQHSTYWLAPMIH